ncbi:branched-chain amino acid ABC transporter permease [Halobacterium sp. KA-6]|jgi:branched-chain amino acid transport system permease protein|uniref:branched-chain amino acid ABC transporter permease n=1 Tax=Halobacterium sp. KA-6 TaxID=2896368 RepID=UPI001E56A1CA|nr:branched-chain amino acid ABC transporter permease [Halobacterium sp. KA-6]MCD2203384.1 branched-chain amino acid ABC transporter permease [Halobacterium sp. KA-6]
MSNPESTATPEDELDVDLRNLKWTEPIRTAVFVLFAGLIAVPLVISSSYVGYVSLLVLMFGIMASGYNIMLGWPNLLVFCPAALAVIGGVVSSLLAIQMGLPFVVTLLIGGVTAAIVGSAVAMSAIIIGSTFEIVIATLAFEQIVYYVFTNWGEVGPTGISGMPSPSLGPLVFTSQIEQYVFLLAVLVLVIFIVTAFDRSLFGTLAIATGEDEELLRSIGYNPSRYKLISVVLGSFVLGIGGALYAHVNGLITPGAFTLDQTVLLLVIAVLGGLRTIYGPIVGAILMIGLPEIIRSMGFGDYRPYVIGVTLILVILFLPSGIVGGFNDYFDGFGKKGDSSWAFWK